MPPARSTKLKSRDERRIALQRSQARARVALDLGGLAIGKGFKYAAVAYCIYQARLAIEALAGRETLAVFLVSLGRQLTITIGTSLVAATLAMGWALAERRFRKRRIAELSARMQDLERMIDHRRSSSDLPPMGHTRPEDAP